MNELLGSTEVARLLELEPATIWVYTSRGLLPQPDMTTARQKLWFKDTIVDWAQTKGVGCYRKGNG